MRMQGINLTDAEWSVMDCLWERGALTGREAAELLRERCGWSRSTALTLLSRLEAKGAVSGAADASVHETQNFLGRVYKGSVSLMLSALTKKQALTQKEIDELCALLHGLEEENKA